MHAACWACRSRTIQCDQTSTPCAKCKKAGLECFDKRPLRWVKGVAIRGKMRGQVLGMGPKASDEYPCADSKPKQTSHPSATSLAINPTPRFALQDPCVHDLDWSSRFYLDYSVAARHYANAGHSFDRTEDALSPRYVNANLDALHFKRQTIQALSSSLSHPDSSQKDEVMASILLLIFLIFSSRVSMVGSIISVVQKVSLTFRAHCWILVPVNIPSPALHKQ
ncbi:uncharacterized protein N7498_001583 [Penicillium cinerascens]|uniref:Zn(2)-C6 fungal-type domain-containing protein n=1 Tax=Penicillium cinerascens TaxID=70096 RepID=A0A9W9TEH6_9EURO|nr:uncharacterized protein N7498_001583 [Penicillium cinerascens]KAJ5219484.1 hypothetical protein N7498_001583 [Penicillium cinerascens]